MAAPFPPPGFFTDPYAYIYQAWDVLWGVPMAVAAIVLLTFLGTWAVFYFLHRKRIDDLEERVKLRDDQIAHLHMQPPTSPSLSLFFPEYFSHTFYARSASGGIKPLESATPQERENQVLKIAVTFTAVPNVKVEHVYLEVINKRLPSYWKPQTVHHRMTPDVAFDIPAEVNAGPHRLKLIAIGAGFEKASPEFQIDFPAR